MSHPFHHSLSSSRKFGGVWQDYIKIHDFFDETKSAFPDMRHRALRHHSEGIFWCEQQFGTVITNSDGKEVPVRFIGEQHVMEDLGWIPTIGDYLKEMNQAGWMYKPGEGRKLLKEIKEQKLDYAKEKTNDKGSITILSRVV
jgi:hypothetical protein